MTDAPSTAATAATAATATLVLTRGLLPGVRTARVLVGDAPPRQLRAGQALTLELAPGPHEVRVLAGGARSHLHRVVLEAGHAEELQVGTTWPDDGIDAAPVPALLGTDDRVAPIAWRDGTPFDTSSLPFWAFLLGVVAPPVGVVVAALALRRSGLSTTARGLVVTGLVSGASYVLALVVGAVWVFAGDA